MSIKLKHIQYVYGQGTAYEKQALKDVSLEIPQGQFLGTPFCLSVVSAR